MSDDRAPRRPGRPARPGPDAPTRGARELSFPGSPRPARDRETIRRRLASGFYGSVAVAEALAARLLDAGALE